MTYKEKMLKIDKLHEECDASCAKIGSLLKINLNKVIQLYDNGYICLTEKYNLMQKYIAFAKNAVDAAYRHKFQLIEEIAKEEAANE